MTLDEREDRIVEAIAIVIVNAVFGLWYAWMAQIACAAFWKPVAFWPAFAVFVILQAVLGMIFKR